MQIIQEKLYTSLDVDSTDHIDYTKPEPLEYDEQYIDKRQWGKCRPYLFNENDEPVIVIGPHYPLFICAYFAFIAVSIVMIKFAITKNLGTILICLTCIVCICQLISYLLVALRNPGVANVQSQNAKQLADSGKQNQVWFCKECNIIQLSHTVHCQDCKVCILDMDHHCPWTGKCIGRGNLKEFYGFLLTTLVYMVFNIVVSMTQATKNKTN